MLERYSFKRLSPDFSLKPFDCNNEIINGFFHEDALNHMSELLSVTYVFESDTETVAYFSVLNDKITIEDAGDKNAINRLGRQSKIPNNKRRDSYPSVKIGRLGVNNGYKRKGIGSGILDLVKMSFIENNKTGCRFITVDAINAPETRSFYEKNGFKLLTSEDQDECGDKDTRLMYFDLMKFKSVAP